MIFVFDPFTLNLTLRLNYLRHRNEIGLRLKLGEFCVSLFFSRSRCMRQKSLWLVDTFSGQENFTFSFSLGWFPRAKPLWSRPLPVNHLCYHIGITSLSHPLSHRYRIAITSYQRHPSIRTSFSASYTLAAGRTDYRDWLIDLCLFLYIAQALL